MLKIAIAIATTGRRDLVSAVVKDLPRQTLAPYVVGLAPARPGDVDAAALAGLPFPVVVAEGPPGSCAQRNTLIRALSDADIFLFLDDDFLMADTYLAECDRLFQSDPSIVVATGQVIIDGATGPGFTLGDARVALASDIPPVEEAVWEIYNGYGCNMAVRAEVIRRSDIMFDEALPLYGWLEDLDLSRRLASFGRIVRSNRCRGVHMGAKSGKQPGVRFGYSQVANPIYLRRKGVLDPSRARRQITRNLTANLARMLFAEPWVDRRGRSWGNLLALADLAAGRLDTRRITALG